jgi:hypothetical protein
LGLTVVNDEVRALWQVIRQSDLISGDDRFPTVELSMVAGAFPHEEEQF